MLACSYTCQISVEGMMYSRTEDIMQANKLVAISIIEKPAINLFVFTQSPPQPLCLSQALHLAQSMILPPLSL